MTEAVRLQDDARSDDPWREAIMSYANARNEVRPEEVLRDVLAVPLDRQDKPMSARVRSIFRAEGWVTCTRWTGRKNVRVWRPPSVADDPGPPPAHNGADTPQWDDEGPDLLN
jgi:predicted P-loop ATPase